MHSKKKDLTLDTASELLIVLYNKSFVTNVPYQYGFVIEGFVKTSSIHISQTLPYFAVF